MKRLRTITAAATAAITVCAALVMTVSPASAGSKPKPSNDPNTAVASDGSTSTAPEFSTNLRGVNSFAGTGVTVKGTESAPPAESGTTVEHAENGQESVIGADNRVQITATTSFPYRAIVHITRDGNGWCTGWMINSNTVATAGHCVAPGGTGAFYGGTFRVYPGRNGASIPYGSCTARRLHSVSGWVSSGDERYDYGALKLNCTVGNSTGWFGFWWQSASLTGLPTTISGYPGDKAFGTLWRSTDQVRVTQDRQIFYQNDTIGGMSGSPVYQNRAAGSSFCVGQCSMAIHAYGVHGSSPHSTNNHGTRITEPVFNNLISWRNAA
ncbi:trypsin-like serine peptidase [Nakamurella sp.]|uniref:trypsin-like serine peptidase n=1 Tax=Nakamurella sp. TaxID=1869182 RepID=UPI003B3AD925